MQPSSPIYFLEMPFAQNGDKTIIPAETATASGRATQSEGFPESTQLPIKSGGVAPNRWDFNGMFFFLSQFAHWEQSGGQATWNSGLGYTPPSIVYYNKVYYVCIAESGPETDAGAVVPSSDDGTYWRTLWDYLSDGQSFVKSGDTVTLTGDTTGSGTFDSDGNVSVATTTTTAAKLGSSTVGGTARGIYLDSGTATAMSATVGSGTQPVYLSSGTVTASSSTVGTSANPVYLSSGTITASDSTIGSTTSPIYMDAGVLKECGSISGVPVGTVIMYYGSSAPDGYFICNGKTFVASSYPELYELLGTNVLPDLRDRFIRGVSSSRAVGTEEEDAGREITGTIPGQNYGGDSKSKAWWGQVTGAFYNAGTVDNTRGDESGDSNNTPVSFAASRCWGDEHTADEFRPINTALLFCIKHD